MWSVSRMSKKKRQMTVESKKIYPNKLWLLWDDERRWIRVYLLRLWLSGYWKITVSIPILLLNKWLPAKNKNAIQWSLFWQQVPKAQKYRRNSIFMNVLVKFYCLKRLFSLKISHSINMKVLYFIFFNGVFTQDEASINETEIYSHSMLEWR